MHFCYNLVIYSMYSNVKLNCTCSLYVILCYNPYDKNFIVQEIIFMNPDLLIKELINYLDSNNHGQLFKNFTNGYLISTPNKWAVAPLNDYKLQYCSNKKFLYYGQSPMKSNEKLTEPCIPMLNSSKIISYSVRIDFYIRNANEHKDALEMLSLVFTHTLPRKKPKHRLLCI